uniref:DNA polymerase eta n=1 Tax=Petromyzon marinus TaxID=7757 RepID=A0AAJ7TKW7_PETMA|nr:DNA polymerase eta isoform X2 [Petromyzon marinus]
MERGTERVVALVDMDCFYVQVEQKFNPQLKGKPCVVVQYKGWRGGGIIAVSYEARAFGVSRNMRGDEARKLCPELLLARVPEAHGKADLTRYREASVQVLDVMARFAIVERASIDEAYMDLTDALASRISALHGRPLVPDDLPGTHVEGWPRDREVDAAGEGDPAGVGGVEIDRETRRVRGLAEWLSSLGAEEDGEGGAAATNGELRLAMGATLVAEMRAAVEAETGFQCSAGIAHNKTLAKLACGMNKPNKQTVLSLSSIPKLFATLPISKIRHLGGKLGSSVVETLGVETMGQLVEFTEGALQAHFGEKTGSWLHDLCRGVEFEPVRPRQLPKSIGCSKNFMGREALDTKEKVQHWLQQLSLELEERLSKDRDMNNRVAKLLTAGVRLSGDQRYWGLSRSCPLARYDARRIASDALALIAASNTAGAQHAEWSPAVTCLYLSATKFSDSASSSGGIASFLTGDASATQSLAPPTQKPLPPPPSATPEGQRNGWSPAATDKPGILAFFRRTASRLDGLRAGSETPVHALTCDLPTKSIEGSCPEPQTRLPARSPQNVISSFFQRRALGATTAETTTTAESSFVAEHPCDAAVGKSLGTQAKDITAGSADPNQEMHDSSKAASEAVNQVECEKEHGKTASAANKEGNDGGFEFLNKNEDECGFAALAGDDGGFGSSSRRMDRSTSQDPEGGSASWSTSEDYVLCEKCNARVLVWEMPEHTDYHFARNLQDSFSAASPIVPHGQHLSPAPPPPKHSQRGKVTRKKTGENPAAKRQRTSGNFGTLDAFFKKSPG